MIFYELSDNTAIERKWVIATLVNPTSPIINWSCPDCGRAAEYPSGSFDVSVEGGDAFPDFLGCGSYPFLVVSARVVETWRLNGIHNLCSYSVGIADVIDSDADK